MINVITGNNEMKIIKQILYILGVEEYVLNQAVNKDMYTIIIVDDLKQMQLQYISSNMLIINEKDYDMTAPQKVNIRQAYNNVAKYVRDYRFLEEENSYDGEENPYDEEEEFLDTNLMIVSRSVISYLKLINVNLKSFLFDKICTFLADLDNSFIENIIINYEHRYRIFYVG